MLTLLYIYCRAMSRDYAVNLKNFFIPRTRRRSSSFFRKNLRTQCIQSQRVATAPVFFADKNKGGAARRPLCLIGRLLFYGVSWVNDCFCPGRAVLTFYGKYVLSRPIGLRPCLFPHIFYRNICANDSPRNRRRIMQSRQRLYVSKSSFFSSALQ